jgi:hypothetical protein
MTWIILFTCFVAYYYSVLLCTVLLALWMKYDLPYRTMTVEDLCISLVISLISPITLIVVGWLWMQKLMVLREGNKVF